MVDDPANDFRLFTASLLSFRKDLDFRQRAAILDLCRPPKEQSLDACLDSIQSAFMEYKPGRIGRQRGSAWPTAHQVKKAREQYQYWNSQNIRVVSLAELGITFEDGLAPRLWLSRGNARVTGRALAAVINSRKKRRLSPADRWIVLTREMVEHACREGYYIVSSLGNAPYELVSYLTYRYGNGLVLIPDQPLLPSLSSGRPARGERWEWESSIDWDRTLVLSPFLPGPLPKARERYTLRDRFVIGMASRLLVAEISRGGNMETLALNRLQAGGEVWMGLPAHHRSNRVDPAQSVHPLIDYGAKRWESPRKIVAKLPSKNPGPALGYSPEIRSISDFEAGEYLIHFTRSNPGPWPGQDLWDYYRALVDGDDDAGHLAVDALKRILKEGKIRGSRLLTRGGDHVVSFTACGPDDWPRLMFWRRALIRWTLEPYGLALPKKTLIRLGAKPVIYGGDELWSRLPEKERFRFQLHNPPLTDWTSEREWRLAGDLELNRIPAGDIRILTPSRKEAETLSARHGLPAVLTPFVTNQESRR